ncbi:MAG: N-6 DNA methylase, partial [Bacteroidales bacterium]|nr:N-6 DNA methylase [Bacteroidales bacterium]
LTYELAYEYWHKMLFAKFLEANGLLMHPDGVAVTMEECEELAKEEGYSDKWDIAASFASKMLPAIFRPEDPLMQISFSPDDRIKLEEILEVLDNYIFTADDALGWVYQFWQSEAKDAINKSGDKIDGKKLPAVTQLFTEPYMVHFLIDNTIGAWWVSRNPGIKPPVKFEYLRFLEDGTPAAGKFEGWPDRTAEITAMDPCMGSGHFVVSLFNVLVNLRMYEEGLTREEATDRVIAENLHGLEIDPRCTQIAAFNLAMTAWRFCGRYKELPEMNLACSGIAPKGKKEDWIKLVGKVEREDDRLRMENGMAMLYDHFQLAPELGSLLDPSTIKADLHTASFEQLQPVLKKALENGSDKDLVERGVMAAGIAKAGQLLSKKYTLQITNVPYLERGKQDNVLANYALKNYPDAKADLANMFLDRLLKTSMIKGSVSIVIPQNWLFLTSYKKFREKILKNETWNFIVKLGSGAFSQISGEVVKAILISISHSRPDDKQAITGLDVSDSPNACAKEAAIKTDELKRVKQKEQLFNPNCVVSFDSIIGTDQLSKYADSIKGTDTGDDPRFTRSFFEVSDASFPLWMKYHSTPDGSDIFDGKNRILLWENENGSFINDSNGTIRRRDTLIKKAIAIRLTGKLEASLFSRCLFDTNAGAIVPKDERFLPAIFCFCSSESFHSSVRKLDQALKATNAVISKVLFDIDYWQKVALEKYPNGLPIPYSEDPTQWIFHGHPGKSDQPLQVALSRLLGYRWPAESDTEMELADDARELIKEIKKFDHFSDNDGILCIPSVNKEETAANRLRDYLKEIFGDKWNNNIIRQLLEKENAKSSSLESWLRNEFFIQHCRVFHNRPFIWHIWDGRNDGFSALVNYHKLNKENLTKLIYTYLGDWIRMCEMKKKAGESGAEGLLSAAQKLKDKLELIFEGEAPYDIFVRWKPLEQQPIGWDPDLNDGVRLNIRPFILADVL